MARQKSRYTQTAGISPIRIQGTNTPVQGDSEYAFKKALRTFNRKVADADILGEARRREFYEKPTTRRRRERDQARRRAQRRQAELNQPQAW